VVFDPLRQIQEHEQMNGEILKIFEFQGGRYQELRQPYLENVGLGFTLWEGEFENRVDIWLRWCDQSGNLIPTGAERAERLAQKLRELGINPEDL
jgi:hypothetical protein